MPLTVSTPYKTDTVASVSGTTFTSNGTPFVVGDVGRFIRLTTGAGAGQIRKIAAYVSTTQVTLDVAWTTGYFVADGFNDSAPTAGDGWVMSYTLDDLDNGTDIVKSTNGNHFRFAASVTLNGTTFVADENRQVDLAAGSDFVIIATTACFMLGSMHPSGYAQNGCSLVDNSGGAIVGGWTGSSSNGNSGDLHLYGCNITSVGANLFWRLYRGSAHIVRFVSCNFYGNLGMRIQGTNSIIKSCKFIGNFSPIGPFGPISPFGLISGVEIRNCLRGARYVYNLGVGDIFGPRFSELTNGAIETVSGASSGKVIGVYDYVQSELLPYPFVSGQVEATSGVDWYQYIDTAIVDLSLSAVTDAARRVIKDINGTTKNDATTTSGSFARYNALVNSMRATSTGNKAWSFGTIAAPFVEAVASYKWQTANLSLPLEISSNVTFTMIADAYVTEQNVATVDAYTEIGNLDRLYDRYKSWFVANLATAYPTFGAQKLAGEGATLDCGSANIVVDGTAGSAFAVNTGTDTITIKASTLLAGATFTGITTTGTISFVNGAAAGPALVYTDSTGTSVPIVVSGVRNGTKVRVVRTDTSAELAIGTAGASGFVARVTWSTDLPIRADTAYVSGLDAEAEASALGTLTNTGAALTIVQTPCVIYEGNGIDGSAVTGLTLDAPNNEIDADEADNTMTVQELYAWYKYALMSDDGIRTMFGAITPQNAHKYRVNASVVPLKIDQKDMANSLVLSGGMIYRDDGASVRLAGSGVIEFVVDDVYESQAAEAALASIKNLVEADEIHTATTVEKRLRGTATVLLTKNHTGTPLSTFQVVDP